jgi:hypothetical protein
VQGAAPAQGWELGISSSFKEKIGWNFYEKPLQKKELLRQLLRLILHILNLKNQYKTIALADCSTSGTKIAFLAKIAFIVPSLEQAYAVLPACAAGWAACRELLVFLIIQKAKSLG